MTNFPPGFRWDPKKEQANIKERKIDFTQASKIFAGPTLVTLDIRVDYDEDRYNAVGFFGDRFLNVTYTERDGEIRIISARPATRRERRDLDQSLKEMSLNASQEAEGLGRVSGKRTGAPRSGIRR